ncbi:MAG: hypothetical protein A2677_04065 [Candidatus Komeilibacteria bacterium RIFCSPHIGHO2_01_FULL_52_14]|nr:MAG: hypothetical protein A2677_04065 [Candidatus Komeilibacteria bacterium RIFCSPHIGHO2_01_FULL_52_14]
MSSLMFTTVFTLSFGSFVPTAAALVAGDLVKGPNSDAVYYIDGTMKHVFPDSKTYFTWYASFGAIKTVSVSELDMFPTGTPVAYRPGTKLVTHPNTARVYAVEPSGNLRWVPSEAVALALYGSDWAKMVNDVHELTFGNYTVGSDLTTTYHAKGTLVQKTGDTTIYYVDGTTIRPFASSSAFDTNNLNYDFIVKVSSLSQYTTGSSVTGVESFATISGSGTSTVTGPAGSLTVSLSPSTPAANQVLIGAAASVPMVTLRLQTGGTAVIVDSVTIQRGGLASDAAFTDFDLLRADTWLTLNNSSKTLNSTHNATFNDDFTVPANSTWDVIVAANMAASLATYAGEYPTVNVTAITLKNNSTLSGTLPINGNVMLTNGTITAGTARVAIGANNPSAATKEVGTKDYIVSSLKVNNNSSETAETLVLKSMTFTQNGSAAPSDLENVRLRNTNTGTILGTIAAPADKKLNFQNLNVEILKGNTINLDLLVDIRGGSARTISLDVDQKSHIVVWDNLRGVYVLPSYFSDASYATGDATSPYYDPADTTVGNGKLRIESVAVTPTNVAENKTGVLLGKFKFVADGEAMNVTALGLVISTTTANSRVVNNLTNLVVKDPAGNTVAGPKDPTANTNYVTATATTTDTMTVPSGETIYSIYGDLDSDWTASDTLQVGIYPSAMTVKGDVTGNTITPTPSGQIQSTRITIKSADINVSVAPAPAAQTVVAGAQNFEISNLVLDAADSGSDVRVTSLALAIKSTGAAFPDVVSGVQLFVGATEIPISSRSTACAGATCSTAATNATTTLSIATGNLTVPSTQSKTVKVVVDMGTGATSGTVAVGVQMNSAVTAIDSESQSFTADITPGNGSAMTLAAGGTLDLTLSQDPKAALAVGGTTVNVGQFSLQARYEGMQLNAFGFSLGNPDGGYDQGSDFNQVETLELWESGGSSALGTISVSGAAATVTPSSVATLSINQLKSYIVKAKFRDVTVPSSIAQSNAGMRVTLRWIDADGTSAGSSTLAEPTYSTAFNSFSSYKSIPTVALGSITTDQVTGSGSEVDLFKFSVTANSMGPVGLAKLSFSVSTSSGVRMSLTGYSLYMGPASNDTSSQIADSGDVLVQQGGDNLAGIHQVAVKFDYNHNSGSTQTDLGSGELIEISGGTTKYFTLKGTVSALSSTANDDSIITRMGGDAGFASTALVNVGGIDGAVEHDDFIWSDLNFVSGYNSSTATYTVGWFNGYRVTGLDDNTTTPMTQTD